MAFPSSCEQADHRLTNRSDLARLWASEFGHKQEVAIRVVLVLAAGVGVWLYNGWLIGPVWAIAYLASTAVAFIALRPGDPDRPAALIVGIGSFIVAATVFVSLPLYAIAMGDAVLQFCGVMGVIALCVFTLFREQPPPILHPFDIALCWTAIGVVAATFIPGQPSLAAQAIMVLMCLIVGGYYALALTLNRAAQAQLYETARQQQAAREMEAISRLSGGIAHDFNNILTVIQGSLELYHVVPQGHERDALADEARAASKRASVLVSDLLAFARRAPLDPRALDSMGVLDSVAAHSRDMFPEHVVPEIRYPSEPAVVVADPAALQSALLHLLRNACDAVGHTGTVILAADLADGPAPGASSAPATGTDAHLRFWVADDGPGMTPAVRARAAEPFFTTKPVGTGSGLGLSMAQGFAEQSGGALRIQSSDDGTIVSIHLPTVPGAAPEPRG